ncbi:MAG: glycosyltransferase WbuB [Pedosphaera sp.]|nr:glycosyltransferase WbuB [Pedosphaera sp.]
MSADKHSGGALRILILSQVFWPDTASTAQHVFDLARELVARGHSVEVLASRYPYENPSHRYPAFEKHDGVQIHRLRNTGFGKGRMLGRIIDSLTFNLLIFLKLVGRRRNSLDWLIGMTSPPLVSFVGILVARWKGWRFCYWAMDLQPELAIEASLFRANSFPARLLMAMGRRVFQKADLIVALDHYMAEHIRETRGAAKVTVLPVCPVMQQPCWAGDRRQNPFRLANGFGDRFVVMYSGNQAIMHPLDTLLEGVRELRDDPRFLFVFIGGGVRSSEVTRFREQHGLDNIRQLPYQPGSEIHISLAAADLHVVVMGNGQVGFTHPNKVYGAMYIGRPFLFLGPKASHVGELIKVCPKNLHAAHGDTASLVRQLRNFVEAGPAHWRAAGDSNAEFAQQQFDPRTQIAAMAETVEMIADVVPISVNGLAVGVERAKIRAVVESS